METSEITARLQSLQATAPVGLTGLDPMPYGQTRWNGSVWPNIQVDAYNRLLSDIAGKHRAGMDTQNLIDGLYNLAHGFDYAGKQDATLGALQGMDGAAVKTRFPRLPHDTAYLFASVLASGQTRWAAALLERHGYIGAATEH